MLAINSTSSSVNPFKQPSLAHSNVVPSWSATTAQSARSSSSDATLLGTGSPLPSLCVNARVVENPRPPSSIHCLRRDCISPTCSGVAISFVESGPITASRSAQCPTIVATFKPIFPSSFERYSP